MNVGKVMKSILPPEHMLEVPAQGSHHVAHVYHMKVMIRHIFQVVFYHLRDSPEDDQSQFHALMEDIFQDNPFVDFRRQVTKIPLIDLIKNFVPYILDRIGHHILITVLKREGHRSGIMFPSQGLKLRDFGFGTGDGMTSNIHGKAMRLYMEFEQISQHLVVAGVENRSAVAIFEPNFAMMPDVRKAMKPAPNGFSLMHALLFQKKPGRRCRTYEDLTITDPLKGLDLDQGNVNVVKKLIEDQGYFASHNRKAIMAHLNGVMQQESTEENSKHYKSLEGIPFWTEYTRLLSNMRFEHPSTKTKIDNLVKETVTIIDTVSPEDLEPLMETINEFLKIEMMGHRKVLDELLKNVFLFFLVTDLSTIADKAVKVIDPILYKGQRISRLKYIKYYLQCLASASIQTSGVKCESVAKDLNKIMYAEFGDRYHSYLLCSQGFNNILKNLESSGSQDTQPNNFNTIDKNIQAGVILYKTRPTVVSGAHDQFRSPEVTQHDHPHHSGLSNTHAVHHDHLVISDHHTYNLPTDESICPTVAIGCTTQSQLHHLRPHFHQIQPQFHDLQQKLYLPQPQYSHSDPGGSDNTNIKFPFQLIDHYIHKIYFPQGSFSNNPLKPLPNLLSQDSNMKFTPLNTLIEKQYSNENVSNFNSGLVPEGQQAMETLKRKPFHSMEGTLLQPPPIKSKYMEGLHSHQIFDIS